MFWLLGAGIMFRDVTTLLLDHQAFKDSIDIFVERYQGRKIDVVAGEVACEVDQSLFTNSFGQQFFCRLSPVSCKFPVYTSISCTENVPIGGLLQIQLKKVTFNNDLQCFDIQGLKLVDSYLGHRSHWALVPSLCLFASPTNCQVKRNEFLLTSSPLSFLAFKASVASVCLLKV